MRRYLLALAAIAVTAVATLADSGSAHAQRNYPRYDYAPGPYLPESYYDNGAPAPVADPTGPCYWQRQRIWDGFAWRMRSVRVCG